jgi:glutathione synthase/RimK-type ligase-like ATP-grasp enzyme
MLVVFGSGEDSCIQLVVEAALGLGLEHRLIDQRTLDHDHLLLEVGRSEVSCVARIADEVVDLEDARGVYARPLGIGDSARSRAFSAGFTEWLDLADTLVVNRPISMRSNASKPFQCQLIAEAGFAVPDTLVSNDPDEVRAFADLHGRVIFKSTSGIRSIVTELDAPRLAGLEGVRALPTQFQAYVDGVDRRVHVVGDDVFATEMRTDAIDYRYANRDAAAVSHEPVELDEATASRCRALSTLLDLPLCGIDLRLRPDGSHVCFEVNPMPAFSYYESNTGQPIARSLVEFLAGRG